MKTPSFKDTLAPTISLFASASTLICCALPALFITIGAGATLAGIVSNVPQLIWLSVHKLEVFCFAAIMLTIAGVMQWRGRNAPCPADPAQAKACKTLRKISLGIYLFSATLFLIGGFFAFIAPKLI